MLGVIIRKEIHHSLLTLRFSTMFVICFVLTLSSLVLMSLQYDKRLKDFADSTAALGANLRKMEDYMDLAFMGVSMDKPPLPMSVICGGLEKEMSPTLTVSIVRGLEFSQGPYANPAYLLFSIPDVVYIINIVVSLIALFFAFDAISGEKQSGTLKQVLSNSVPRDQFLLGKWLGGYVVLVVPVILGILAGLLVTRIFTSFALRGEDIWRMVVIVVSALLYISIFFTLGIFLSAVTRSSAASLVICLFIWVIWVLAIPNLSPIVARSLVGFPSRGELSREKDMITRDVMARTMKAMQQEPDRNVQNQMWMAFQEEVEKAWTPHVEKFEQKTYQQANLATMLSRLSPSASYVLAATHLAGTGVKDFERYSDYSKLYLREYRESTSALLKRTKDSFSNAQGINLNDLAKFEPKPVSLATSIKQSALDIGLLFGWNVLFFLGAFLKFSRYEV